MPNGAAYLTRLASGKHVLTAWSDGLPVMPPVTFGAAIPTAEILDGAAARRVPATLGPWLPEGSGNYRASLQD